MVKLYILEYTSRLIRSINVYTGFATRLSLMFTDKRRKTGTPAPFGRWQFLVLTKKLKAARQGRSAKSNSVGTRFYDTALSSTAVTIGHCNNYSRCITVQESLRTL